MVNWWILAQKNFMNPYIKNIKVRKVQFGISEGSASPRRPLEPIEHDEPIEQDSDDDHQSGESAG